MSHPSPELESGAVLTYRHPKKKLTTFMIANIAVISVVGLTCILLLLFGDFEGKFSRVFSTLLLFGAFTAFSAYDSTRDAPARYMPISVVGSIYMLTLSMALIWGTFGLSSFDSFSIFSNTLFLIAIVKVTVIVVQKASDYACAEQEQLALAAKLCTGGIAVTGILLTLPIGLGSFVDFGELYWKVMVAVLLFSGLMISISALLAWFFRDKREPERSRASKTTDSSLPRFGDRPIVERIGDRQEPQAPQPEHRYRPESAAPQPAPAPSGPAHSVKAPAFAPPAAAILPWPVFPNGYPLPATANGRPDFAALEQMAATYVRAERHHFG